MQIGLFFGSFNPIHTGHLIIASSIADLTELDQVWFVVSPLSPFKDKASLLNEYDRLHLVKLAIEEDGRFRSSSVEFKLPRPSYTIDTLIHLREKFPTHHFSVITGSDNLQSLNDWKDASRLLREYTFYVYPRKPFENPYPDNPAIRVVDFPLLDISSTYIRELIEAGKSPRYFLPEPVFHYVDEMNLYKK